MVSTSKFATIILSSVSFSPHSRESLFLSSILRAAIFVARAISLLSSSLLVLCVGFFLIPKGVKIIDCLSREWLLSVKYQK